MKGEPAVRNISNHMLKKRAKRVMTSLVLMSTLFVVSLQAGESSAEKARKEWRPFFTKFTTALKKRDRQAFKQMLTTDIHFSGGGGDDNHDGDTRDDAFKYWDEFHSWAGIENALKKGTVPMALWWNNGNLSRYPSRVAPPIANRKGNRSYRYYAIFEFRDDEKWYCVVLNQCCD